MKVLSSANFGVGLGWMKTPDGRTHHASTPGWDSQVSPCGYSFHFGIWSGGGVCLGGPGNTCGRFKFRAERGPGARGEENGRAQSGQNGAGARIGKRNGSEWAG